MEAVGVMWMMVTIALIHFTALLGTGIFIKNGKKYRARSVAKYEYYSSMQYEERTI